MPGLNQLVANKQKVQDLKPRYQPVYSQRVAIYDSDVKDVVNEYYNLMTGARDLLFAGAFSLDFFPREDEQKLPFEQRLRIPVDMEPCLLSDGNAFKQFVKALESDNVIVKREGSKIIFAPPAKLASLAEGSATDEVKFGSLTIVYSPNFFRVNPSDSRIYINAYPSLATPVEFCRGESTQVAFRCMAIPCLSIAMKQIQERTEYVFAHGGYYNLEVMAQRSFDATVNWLGAYEEYLPSVSELVKESQERVGLRPWVLQRMQLEQFLKNIGIENPQELKSLHEIAKSSGSFQMGESKRVEGGKEKILTDQLIETLLQKRLKSKEVLFTDFCLNSKFVSNFLRYNAESKIAKPLTDKRRQVFTAFLEACREAEQSGLTAGAAKLVQAYSGKNLTQEIDFSGIREQLLRQSPEQVAESRLEDFNRRLPDCVQSQTLCDEMSRRMSEQLRQYVELIASDEIFLEAPMNLYATTFTPFLREAELEDSYVLERKLPRATGKLSETVRLIAETIDVPVELLEATNAYYAQSNDVMIGIGQDRYQEREAHKLEAEEQKVSFQDRGYGAVDPNSNPYEQLIAKEESEQKSADTYTPQQDAQGNWFTRVGDKRVPLTPDMVEKLMNVTLPDAELSGLSEIPNPSKEGEKSKRPSRGKRREQAAGD